MSLKENVLDLTHFGYVHAKSFGITDWKEPPAVTVEGDVVTYRQVFTASPLAPIYAHAIGVAPGKPFDRDNYGSFVSPALQVAAVDFNDPDPAPGARDRFRLRICHATTPVDPHHMEYFWMMGRDHGTTPEMMERLRSGVMQGFKEDEAIIQAAQDMLRRAPFSAERPEFSVRADSAAVQARRALERWLSRE
jgi:vanillate O-demethylase monooxygenase subunit